MTILKDTVLEKLNSNNYDAWKFLVEIYLQKEDLFTVIDHEAPNPITDVFTRKNRKARAIINLLMEDDHIIHVKGLGNAR